METVTKLYKCPKCGATKELEDRHNYNQFPKDLPCGWRGCEERAVPVK